MPQPKSPPLLGWYLGNNIHIPNFKGDQIRVPCWRNFPTKTFEAYHSLSWVVYIHISIMWNHKYLFLLFWRFQGYFRGFSIILVILKVSKLFWRFQVVFVILFVPKGILGILWVLRGIWIILVFLGYFSHFGIFKIFWRFQDYFGHFGVFCSF